MTATTTKKRKQPDDAMPQPSGDANTIPRDSLARALSVCGRAVPSKGAKPVLANVLLTSGKAIATDLEVRVEMPLEYSGPLVLLPHGRLSAIVKETPDALAVELYPDGTACLVKAGRGSWRLPTEPVEEFPSWGVVDARPLARMPQEVLARMLRSVSYATDTESSRYALGGVLLEMKGGELSAVATDGRRLSVVTETVDQATDDASVVVPAHAVVLLLSMLTSSEGGVQLEVTASELVATCDEGPRLVARLLEGRFPKWREVVPANTSAPRAAVNHDELLAAVRQAAIVTSEQSKGVKFTFDTELWLRGRSAESGQSEVQCPLLQALAKPVAVRLDPEFVCDALRWADGDEPVEIHATGSGDAVAFYSGSLVAVIMPMAEE